VTRFRTLAVCAVALLVALPGTARAQTSVADLLGRPATAEGQPKTYLEELTLYGYVEKIPALALAGLFAQQGRKPVTDGTLPTDTVLFAGLVIATVLIVGALSYLPVLALGPVVEHLALK
jgi:potassium-transporting ATPase A subunit